MHRSQIQQLSVPSVLVRKKGALIQTYTPRVPEAKNTPINLGKINHMTVAGDLHKECHRVNFGEMAVVWEQPHTTYHTKLNFRYQIRCGLPPPRALAKKPFFFEFSPNQCRIFNHQIPWD